jgi:hypothetical protein
LTDFLLGAGWIAVPLVVGYAMNRAARPADMRASILPWLAVAQIVAVALSGTLRAETARVWLFLLPLLAIPVALELDTWSPRARIGALLAQFALMCSIGGNLWFVIE